MDCLLYFSDWQALAGSDEQLPRPALRRIDDRPFLFHLLEYLAQQGISRFLFLTDPRYEDLSDVVGFEYENISISYLHCNDKTSAGVGMLEELKDQIKSEFFLIADAQRIFEVNVSEWLSIHRLNQNSLSLAYFQTSDASPQYSGWGLASRSDHDVLEAFLSSAEDTSPKSSTGDIASYHSTSYYADMRKTKDYYNARYEMGIFPKIDRNWTLFLDRDGVINQKLENDYVKNLDELKWIKGSLDSIARWRNWVGHMFVVTNQQGIGKGIMSEGDLSIIHEHVLTEISSRGGAVNAIYHAPQLSAEGSIMRKPKIGMALKAQEDFPQVDFANALMVGDSISDMEFAHNAGMKGIFIHPTQVSTYDYYVTPSLQRLTDIVQSRR